MCHGFPEIYARLEEGLGSICHGYMCIVNMPWVYVHCAIHETYLVQLFSRDLCLIGGVGVGVNLPWVYVHCAIYL